MASIAPATAYAPQVTGSKPLSLTFHQAYGFLGIVMLLLALVCALWISWLIALTIAPNATANYLMNTGEFDDGTFWLIVDPEPVLMVFSCAGLSIIVFGYMLVLAQMTFFRNRKRGNERASSWTRDRSASFPIFGSRWCLRAAAYWSDTTSFHGRYRKYWNFKFKVIDLVLESITLYQYMERGCPKPLLYGYAALITSNAWVYAICILTSSHLSAFTEVLIDSIFDLLVTIAFPINVLAYCYHNFQLDRAVLLLNMKVYPPGSFEASARLSSDPTQIALFRLIFDSLRIQSGLDFVLRISMNMSLCYRFIRIVDIVAETRQRTLEKQSRSSTSASQVEIAQHSLPRAVAIALLTFAIVVVVVTQKSVASSYSRCHKYPECVAYANRWPVSPSAGAFCPCIAIVDMDRAPKTYEAWISPINMTDRVRVLASSGDLHVLQIINRNLAEWPTELQRCTNLLHITLIYTGTATLPAWAKMFRNLEYLHIEGTKDKGALRALEDDLFASMRRLTFLHLGVHPKLSSLPSLRGPVNLKVLYLAGLLSMQGLPAVSSLNHLERLEIMGLPLLAALPDMAPLTRLVQVSIASGGLLCCNGFLDTPCNLSSTFCSGSPSARCLNGSAPKASQATIAVLQRFSSSVCKYVQTAGAELITSSSVGICQGVNFKQCPENAAGVTGICASIRMQVIRCVHEPNIVTMRRQQIQLGIGPPCNATAEAWLGCSGP